jgi:hypothetical protein
MTGERLYVVVWEDHEPVRVIEWHDWLRIPIPERAFDTTMVKAKDELHAFARVTRGESWATDWFNKGAN